LPALNNPIALFAMEDIMRLIVTFLLLIAVADMLSACVVYDRPCGPAWHDHDEGWRDHREGWRR
jgi:hypothetical protein